MDEEAATVAVVEKPPPVRRGDLFAVCVLFTGGLIMALLFVLSVALLFTVLFTPFAIAALRRLLRCGFVGDVNFRRGAVAAGWWRDLTMVSLVPLSPVMFLVWCLSFILLFVQAIVFYPFMLACALCVPLPPSRPFFAEFHFSYTQAVKFTRTIIVAALIPAYEPIPVNGTETAVTPIAVALTNVRQPAPLGPSKVNGKAARPREDEHEHAHNDPAKPAASPAALAPNPVSFLSKSRSTIPPPQSASSRTPAASEAGSRRGKQAAANAAAASLYGPGNPVFYPNSNMRGVPAPMMVVMPDGSVQPLPASMAASYASMPAQYVHAMPMHPYQQHSQSMQSMQLPYGAMSASLQSFQTGSGAPAPPPLGGMQAPQGQLVQTSHGLQYMYFPGAPLPAGAATYTDLNALARNPPLVNGGGGGGGDADRRRHKRRNHRKHRSERRESPSENEGDDDSGINRQSDAEGGDRDTDADADAKERRRHRHSRHRERHSERDGRADRGRDAPAGESLARPADTGAGVTAVALPANGSAPTGTAAAPLIVVTAAVGAGVTV